MYATDEWKQHRGFFGGRECFLWTFSNDSPRKFVWSDGSPDYFMLYNDDSGLQMGGGEISTSHKLLTNSKDSKKDDNKDSSISFSSAIQTTTITSAKYGGCGLWLDKDLTQGRTSCCASLNSCPLTASGNEQFGCAVVEVYALH
jgi:hypothetical protein